MVSTLGGILRVAKPVFLKALSPILRSRESGGNSKTDRDPHLENEYPQMNSTLAGMEILSKCESRKAPLPIPRSREPVANVTGDKDPQ
jgi:hypothetical protein